MRRGGTEVAEGSKVRVVGASTMSRLFLAFSGEGGGRAVSIAKEVLWPLSLAYGAGVRAIRWTYSRGLKRPKEAPIPVVSVGNLVWGGTGKTQTVIWLCRRLSERGLKVAVLHRGHRGIVRGPRVVGRRDKANDVGDEPLLLARSLPETVIILSKRREEGARLAAESGAEVAVLDDGLQYWRLRKDVEIAMWVGPLPPKKVRLIPSGPWREPLSILREVDQVWSIEGEEAAESVNVAFRVVPLSLRRLEGDGKRELPPEALKGRRVLGFCAIGRPRAFARTLSELGAEGKVLTFPNHWRFGEEDLKMVGRRAREVGASLVVTTEKDAVRLEGRALPLEVWALSTSLEILRGREEAEELLLRIEALSRGREEQGKNFFR